MRRRILLKMLHSLGLAWLFGATKGVFASSSESTAPSRSRSKLVPGAEFAGAVVKSSLSMNSVVEVGQRCVLMNFTEDWLEGGSVEGLLLTAGYLPGLAPSEFNKAFNSKRYRDFEFSRVEIVDGWILARAEVAICIFFALHVDKAEDRTERGVHAA